MRLGQSNRLRRRNQHIWRRLFIWTSILMLFSIIDELWPHYVQIPQLLLLSNLRLFCHHKKKQKKQLFYILFQTNVDTKIFICDWYWLMSNWFWGRSRWIHSLASLSCFWLRFTQNSCPEFNLSVINYKVFIITWWIIRRKPIINLFNIKASFNSNNSFNFFGNKVIFRFIRWTRKSFYWHYLLRYTLYNSWFSWGWYFLIHNSIITIGYI